MPVTQDGGGKRFNDGKIRFDLLPAFAIEQVARVFTEGAKKYEPNNWKRGMPWSSVLASLERHLQAIKSGQDIDNESGLLHVAHLATNALFLAEYYKIYPQGDDRPRKRIPRIGLDIDGVLADFATAFCIRCGLDSNNVNHWMWTYQWDKRKRELVGSDGFWYNLIPLIKPEDMPFEPVCYCTFRPIDTHITELWIEKNGFPCVPVITVNGSKVEKLKEFRVEIFVDDNYDNFVELNDAGICTYLYDRPHNAKYNVGHKRIHSLKELVE
jgi:hypothetical protein